MGLPFLQLSSHFFNLASLANTYYACAFSFAFFFSDVSPLALNGLGPNFLITLSNSIAVCWNFWPSAAVHHSIRILSGSTPIDFKTSFRYST